MSNHADERSAREALKRWLRMHPEAPRNISLLLDWVAGWLDACKAVDNSDGSDYQTLLTPASDTSDFYRAGWRYYVKDAMLDEPLP